MVEISSQLTDMTRYVLKLSVNCTIKTKQYVHNFTLCTF